MRRGEGTYVVGDAGNLWFDEGHPRLTDGSDTNHDTVETALAEAITRSSERHSNAMIVIDVWEHLILAVCVRGMIFTKRELKLS